VGTHARLSILSHRERRRVIAPPAAFELPNDAAAAEKAKQLPDGHDIEIWQGARMVAYLVSD